MTDPMTTAALEDHARRFSAAIERVVADRPDLPYITAVVMANDELSRDTADARLAEGRPFEEAVWFVGSFARLGWAVDHDRAAAVAMLAELWPGSDPDDTDADLLELWREAYAAEGGVVTDDGPLPAGDPLTIYRGQRAGDLLGFAWTLDPVTAGRFASGASYRTAIDNGVIVVATVERSAVLGYLSDRGESEVIVDIEAGVTVVATERWVPARS